MTEGLPDQRPNRRWRHLPILVVLLVSAPVWLWTANRDLPYVHHPDEPTNLRVVNAMIEDDDRNPHFFHYPSLSLYIHAAVHLEGPFLGWLDQPEGVPGGRVVGTNRTETPGSLRVHRAVSVAFGLAIVALVYATSLRLTRRTGPSLLAALTAATSVTVIANARFVAPDVIAAALCTGVLWAAVGLWRSPTVGRYLLAGAGVGLAASAKYNAVLVATTVVAAAALAPGLRRELRGRFVGLVAAGAAAIAAFLLTTPYALLDSNAFLDDLRFEREHYAQGHDGMDGDSLQWYVEYLLTSETVLVLLAAIGLGFALSGGHRRAAAIVSAFPLAYGMLAAFQEVRNARTILLVLPHLAVLVALGAQGAAQWVRARPRPARVGIAAGAVLLVAVQASQVLGVLVLGPAAHIQAQRIGHVELGTSTWQRARVWIEEHVPEGSSVLIEPYSPWVDVVRYDVEGIDSLGSVADPDRLSWDYLVASEESYRRAYERPGDPRAEVYDQLFRETETVATFDGVGPTIRVLRVPNPAPSP